MTAVTGDGGVLSAQYRGLPDNQAGELMRISREHGGLTEEIVLKAAESPDSPLHPRFTWDDTEAAHCWRLREAGMLIRRFRVEVITVEGVLSIPRFVTSNVPSGLRMRVPVEDVLGDDARLQAALADTRRQIIGLRNRLAALSAAAGVVDALDVALAALDQSAE